MSPFSLLCFPIYPFFSKKNNQTKKSSEITGISHWCLVRRRTSLLLPSGGADLGRISDSTQSSPPTHTHTQWGGGGAWSDYSSEQQKLLLCSSDWLNFLLPVYREPVMFWAIHNPQSAATIYSWKSDWVGNIIQLHTACRRWRWLCSCLTIRPFTTTPAATLSGVRGQVSCTAEAAELDSEQVEGKTFWSELCSPAPRGLRSTHCCCPSVFCTFKCFYD